MPTGVVKWFSREKGYGFIVPDDGGATKDIFVHHSCILMQGYRVLETGQRVTYKEKSTDNGPMAYDVIIGQETAGQKRICPTCHQEIEPAPAEPRETQ